MRQNSGIGSVYDFTGVLDKIGSSSKVLGYDGCQWGEKLGRTAAALSLHHVGLGGPLQFSSSPTTTLSR
jgi:hypothetical protein